MSTAVTATFVFTDLVESTATATRLGPEAADELRRTHFKLLRGAVSGSGGVEVKNLGDGLMVMYSSPSRALAGAVGMAQAIEHHNRSTDEPLGVRIGVSAGEVVEEDGDFFGDPVVEAARLCAAAEGGQVLITQLVRMMVGRHATQTFVELGPLELKGLPGPVDTVEVQWDPVTLEGSVPLPGRLAGVASAALFGFFGREAELEALEHAAKRARTARRSQVVFVSGEAGMGKTSLVARFAHAAHGSGAAVLFGHADEDLGVAYQPWIEALSGLVRDGDPEWIGDLPSAQRNALARLVPHVAAEGDRVADPETERLLLLEGVAELLVAASQESSVVVVLDDLHWADTASLQLLRHVTRSSNAMDVTIVCTYRDTDLSRGDALTQLLADMHREDNATRIALAGLGDRELVELLAAAAGHELDEEGIGLAHVMRRETEGNPFFTAELLRHLGESGGIVLGADGRWALAGELEELGLPSSVRDVVGRRVERLGDEALRVLAMAAVIGREFHVDLLAELCEIGVDPLLDLLDAAVNAAILVESDIAYRYRFAHALTQHSLYDELSVARRQRAHQRIAEALEAEAQTRDAATLAELAHHWVAATRPADLDKALGYIQLAGDAALDALSPEDAIRWYRHALDLLTQQAPDEHQRALLLAKLGTAQRQAAHPEYRETLLQAAALATEVDDTAVLVQAALGFAQGETMMADDDIKRVAAAALERIGAGSTPTRARLLATLAGAHDATAEWAARRDLSLEAIGVARESADPATFVHTIDPIQTSLATPDRLVGAIDDMQRAVQFADGIDDPMLRIRSRFHLVWARYQQADLTAADAVLAEMQEIGEGIGLPYPRWLLAATTSGRLLLAGQADEAEAANESALALGATADIPDALGAYGGVLFFIRAHQGRFEEIADFFIDIARDNPSIAVLRAAVPHILSEIGRIDEARERLLVEAETGFDVPFDLTWLSGMSSFLDVAATTGERAAARTLVDRVAPHATQVVSPTAVLVRGAIARPLARAATVLGEHDRAEEWFAIAHDIHARLHAPYWIALGQLDHADLCLARRADGDVERARDLIGTAATIASEHGCAGLTTRADKLLELLP